jgi:PhoH-like ATPase
VLNKQTRRCYVLDTSVLLSDPLAMTRFEEHEVVIPLVVITELEGKRKHIELGWSARRALRELERFRQLHGDLSHAFPVNDKGGTLRVELNHVDSDLLPHSLTGGNDNRILAVAANLSSLGSDVTLVTKDLPLRLKASVVGIDADEYHNESVPDTRWTGMTSIKVDTEMIDALFKDEQLTLDKELPVNSGVVLTNGSQSAIARMSSPLVAKLVPSSGQALTLRPRSAEQHLALDLLLDNEVGIVSLGGKAGTGKTVLALAASLDLVLRNRGPQRKIVVFRPLYAVAEQTLGYLPGTEEEKMEPWAAAVYDALDAIDSSGGTADKVRRNRTLEILPITHIRGRTFSNTILIIEEAQQWERIALLSLLTRVGVGSRVFLTHDMSQRDNLRVGPHDGIASVVEMLKGNPLFGHVTFTRQERSPVAELASEILAVD